MVNNYSIDTAKIMQTPCLQSFPAPMRVQPPIMPNPVPASEQAAMMSSPVPPVRKFPDAVEYSGDIFEKQETTADNELLFRASDGKLYSLRENFDDRSAVVFKLPEPSFFCQSLGLAEG